MVCKQISKTPLFQVDKIYICFDAKQMILPTFFNPLLPSCYFLVTMIVVVVFVKQKLGYVSIFLYHINRDDNDFEVIHLIDNQVCDKIKTQCEESSIDSILSLLNFFSRETIFISTLKYIWYLVPGFNSAAISSLFKTLEKMLQTCKVWYLYQFSKTGSFYSSLPNKTVLLNENFAS